MSNMKTRILITVIGLLIVSISFGQNMVQYSELTKEAFFLQINRDVHFYFI